MLASAGGLAGEHPAARVRAHALKHYLVHAQAAGRRRVAPHAAAAKGARGDPRRRRRRRRDRGMPSRDGPAGASLGNADVHVFALIAALRGHVGSAVRSSGSCALRASKCALCHDRSHSADTMHVRRAPASLLSWRAAQPGHPVPAVDRGVRGPETRACRRANRRAVGWLAQACWSPRPVPACAPRACPPHGAQSMPNRGGLVGVGLIARGWGERRAAMRRRRRHGAPHASTCAGSPSG